MGTGVAPECLCESLKIELQLNLLTQSNKALHDGAYHQTDTTHTTKAEEK